MIVLPLARIMGVRPGRGESFERIVGRSIKDRATTFSKTVTQATSIGILKKEPTTTPTEIHLPV